MPGFANPLETWNARFAGDDYLFGEAPNAFVQREAPRLPRGATVLCVADGEGRNSVWLAKRGLRVDAFDIAEVGVEKARCMAAEQGVSVNFSVADCDGFAWPEAAYDGVAAIFVQFADPALRTRMFDHLQRCLKPGGTLVLQGYTPRQLVYRTGGPPFESHLYTPALLREAFAAMDIVEIREYEADLAEGSGHHGRSALIGLVARQRGA